MNKKQVVKKEASKKEVVKQEVVKQEVVKQEVAVKSEAESLASIMLANYCLKNDLSFQKSCAKQVTKLMLDKPCTLNDLVLFACNFYDKLQASLPLEKRSIWLTGRSNEAGKKDTPQSTLNKHIAWLFKTQYIYVQRDGANYFIAK